MPLKWWSACREIKSMKYIAIRSIKDVITENKVYDLIDTLSIADKKETVWIFTKDDGESMGITKPFLLKNFVRFI